MSATRSLRRDTGGARCERDPEEVPEQLPELRHDVVRLGARDSEAINGGTQALLDCDRAGADRVISGDACLDELTHSIEERAYRMLALQQPMVSDLRTLVTVVRDDARGRQRAVA